MYMNVFWYTIILWVCQGKQITAPRLGIIAITILNNFTPQQFDFITFDHQVRYEMVGVQQGQKPPEKTHVRKSLWLMSRYAFWGRVTIMTVFPHTVCISIQCECKKTQFLSQNFWKVPIWDPVSRIEFTLKSSVYWSIIGLGTRTWSVAMRCSDLAGQSEFFVRVLHLKTFNWMYCYREFIVGIVVSAIAVFRLVDTILSSSLHC